MSAKIFYKLGSISIMIIGIGHLILHFVLRGRNPAGILVMNQMKNIKVGFGNVTQTMASFYTGFSITMGALLVLAGLQNLFLAASLDVSFSRHKGSAFMAILLAGILFVLSMKYFIILPQMLSLLALIFYSLGFWKLTHDEKSSSI